MQLVVTAQKILAQLGSVIAKMEDKDYSTKIEALSNVSVGQHVRHVVEFFNCLTEGYSSGIVNYDKRKHDTAIEEDKKMALCCMDLLTASLSQKDLSRRLMLEADYALSSSAPLLIETIFERELIYNIEHTIHHMALIKVGIKIVSPELELPYDFGVAASTIRHQQKHVHSNLPS